jgi:hypothetical protein
MSRIGDIDRFYNLLADLEERVGGKRRLKDCTGYMDWPDRGIYVFFASDEQRDTGSELRVTRVGTHAVSSGSGTSLWNRLRNHRGSLTGSYPGGGNHRGSVFRKRVGEALIERYNLDDRFPQWADGRSAGSAIREREHKHEQRVSDYIRGLPFLWVKVDDEPGPRSLRAKLERNAIALLSDYDEPAVDPRADYWLGHHSRSEKIRQSGLWNVDHVDEEYDPEFLETFDDKIKQTGPV